MNTQGFYKLIENIELLNTNTLPEIEQLINDYPYVENFRTLYALNLLILDDYRYKQNLTKAAFYSSDRKKLKYLVDSIQFVEKDDFSELSQAFERIEYPEEIETQQNEQAIVKDVVHETIETEPIIVEKVKEEEPEKKSAAEIEKQKRQIRSKAELLQLVKKRLAEIELEKKGEESPQYKPLHTEQEQSKLSLIDKFIESQPSISRPDKDEFFDPQNEAIGSATDDDDFFVTETLARIHSDQGNYRKATEIYQKLILKIPEKSSYFAAQIQDLNKKQKK